jgi:hypothetical protein
LLSIADIDGDFGGTEVFEGGSRAIILPSDNSWLSTRVSGGGDWGSDLKGAKKKLPSEFFFF